MLHIHYILQEHYLRLITFANDNDDDDSDDDYDGNDHDDDNDSNDDHDDDRNGSNDDDDDNDDDASIGLYHFRDNVSNGVCYICLLKREEEVIMTIG
ncbi:hypothetical protein WUBG_00962 [Wuchereria bancrofti]|uniref:Uncharacterized protein n=1 Tax=Wuchereria bancrofti TaxID=6293 RepID=J9EZV4_WUCBA|nr:hypothetical protein WUBG_00962 [Wuchereria bancrofti]